MRLHSCPLPDLHTARPTETVRELCDRIDAAEPEIQALLPEPGRRERLLAEAQALEQRYPDPASRPPLYGAVVGVKDIIRVDGFETRAGSRLPAELFAGPQASCVTRLTEAGALVLGKTETTEFAYFEPGPTRNPQNPGHTPGGSSSGSAAAVAAGFCPVALGSQTVGSVIRPAAFCGVVGFKFSAGRVPLDGVIPYAPSLDTLGFFVQHACDLSPIVERFCDEDTQPGADDGALGIPEGPYLEQASAEALAAFARQVDLLEARGRRIVRVRVMEDIAAINRRHQRLAAAEMAATHAGWFPQHQALYRPRTAALIREGLTVPETEVRAALAGRAALREELERAMQEAGIGGWICPAAVGPAPGGLGSTGDPVMNLPWTYAGLPVVAVPAGRAANGLPLGLQCSGAWGRDRWLARAAAPLMQDLHGLWGGDD